jgi:hypothetical protein
VEKILFGRSFQRESSFQGSRPPFCVCRALQGTGRNNPLMQRRKKAHCKCSRKQGKRQLPFCEFLRGFCCSVWRFSVAKQTEKV